jgi:CRP/FNR family transcriptional regulator, cyclic AMP receptor protein
MTVLAMRGGVPSELAITRSARCRYVHPAPLAGSSDAIVNDPTSGSEARRSVSDPATSVMYVETAAVPLSVLSHVGKKRWFAVLDAGHFFGEGCLAGQTQRRATATAMAQSTILAVDKPEMVRQLHTQSAFADRFLTHMLTRNIRIEEDLVDQLFNSTEKRIARTLLLLARYGEPEASHRALPKLSQEVLAEMVGTTRSRVNFFMNKFRKLGFIDYNGVLKVNNDG